MPAREIVEVPIQPFVQVVGYFDRQAFAARAEHRKRRLQRCGHRMVPTGIDSSTLPYSPCRIIESQGSACCFA